MTNLLDLYSTFKGGIGGVNEKLIYPLENQSDYLGKITFTPIKEKEIDIASNVESLITVITDNIVAGGKSLIKAAGLEQELNASSIRPQGPGEAIANRAKEKEKKLNLANLDNKFYGAGKVKATASFDVDTLDLETDKRISLYLPRAIQIQDTVTYDNAFQLGLIGGAIEAGLTNGTSGVAASIAGAGAAEVGGVVNSLLGRQGGMSPEAAGILSGKIASKIPVISEAAGGAVRSATRLTTNPNTRAIFKDVPIRNFSFAFQLIPTSQNEAMVIEKIIKQFRTELYPEALEAGGINVGYKFPNRFLIKVKYNRKEIAGIKFLPVYLQSFNATYNSGTGGMHSDGRFTAVDISLAFTETRAITKADVKGGY